MPVCNENREMYVVYGVYVIVDATRRPPRPGRVKSSLHISAQSAKCIRRLMRGAGGGIIFGI